MKRFGISPVFAAVLLLTFHGCGDDLALSTPEAGEPGPSGEHAPVPLASPESAPEASDRLESSASAVDLASMIDTFFSGQNGRRIHIQTDKPLYQPGETIWIKSWDLAVRDLAGGARTLGIGYQLLSPKGAIIATKYVESSNGRATNDIVIPEEAEGGQYTLRAQSFDGFVATREMVVNRYEAPRLKKKLELLRKAYGPGDTVRATLEVKRPTGEPLARHRMVAVIWLDGLALPPVPIKSNGEGGAIVSFKLPDRIDKGDATLTVLVEDGGVTESVSKRVPILLNKLQLSIFPEGGEPVTGLPSRLYIEAKNSLGKPADVEGRIVDDHGAAVAVFSTFHAGLGRVAFTPSTGRSYQVVIDKPVGISERYPVPVARQSGCVLRSYDDFDSQLAAIRLSVRCSEEQEVTVLAMLREQRFDQATVLVPRDEPAVVYLEPPTPGMRAAQGVARITLFDGEMKPLAERLLFRNRRGGLRIEVETDLPKYSPREQVALTVRTSDAKGNPVPADVALSVVDDTVVSFADDKTGHMLSKLLLEPELPGTVEEPNFFFDVKEKKSAAAMDLLLGTRGWRRFDWRPVLAAQPVTTEEPVEGVPAADDQVAAVPDLEPDAEAKPRPRGAFAKALKKGGQEAKAPLARRVRAKPDAARGKRVASPKKPIARPAKRVARRERRRPDPPQDVLAGEVAPAAVAAPPPPKNQPVEIPPRRFADAFAAAGDDGIAGGWARQDRAAEGGFFGEYAPVRLFPAPVYSGAFSGERSDFRETIHWAPNVATGAAGRTTITFYLSDAVTSFRVLAEGASGGLVGRSEKVFKSSLPFSLAVKLPVEVSAGDRIDIPVTLTNDREHDLDIALRASFGELLALEKGYTISAPSVAGNNRDSLFVPVEVTGTKGSGEVRIEAEAGGGAFFDTLARPLRVVPLGFPQQIDQSGTVRKKSGFWVELSDALPGSIDGTVTVYPSPVATLVQGVEGMLREPSGCFEQTSSANYPNVMVMRYLQSHDVADPALLERTGGLLKRGYHKLVGFETPKKGYEWFGQAPAHEALTAYGVLEFADMRDVYPGVDEAMIGRTVDWLKRRRDGKGGYTLNKRALDSFGGANKQVTDAYITYAVTRSGIATFAEEIERQAEAALQEKDPYLLALASNTLLNASGYEQRAHSAVRRLAGLQRKDGSWNSPGHSITRSTGHNLAVETTSLALMALLEDGGFADEVRRGVGWLVAQRRGGGAFGATQATVLALQALTAYADASRTMASPGSVEVWIDGKRVASQDYQAGQREPLEFSDLGAHFKPGRSHVELRQSGRGSLPFSIGVTYRSLKPANHPATVLDLKTEIDRAELSMGENVRLVATVSNRTAQDQPMTLVRVGLPGGLAPQIWQLKELVEKGTVAFYETRGREVILYLRAMAPEEVRELPLDLVANVPGRYTGPASQAYLYYSDDQRVWDDAIAVTITP